MMWEISLSILAGLILFLYAVSSLSSTIHDMSGDRVKLWMSRFTVNTVTAIFTGTVATMLLDSSSAVIIITIILVNSKVLTFRQAMGIVLGANIGTTFSSQIIALDVGKFSPVLLLIGFLLLVISRSTHINRAGRVILYFGILFFGLFTMERAVEPLRDEPFFMELLASIERPITGSIVGATVTLVIQSSSATVGMAIILAKKGLITLTGGIAVMLGAELGTVSDTLLATIKGSQAAIKTGLFHLGFNLLSIITGLLLFYPFLELVKTVSNGAPIEQALANAHMMFNVLGVLIFGWLLGPAEGLLNRLLPEKQPLV